LPSLSSTSPPGLLQCAGDAGMSGFDSCMAAREGHCVHLPALRADVAAEVLQED
jgi:hypothetical protein